MSDKSVLINDDSSENIKTDKKYILTDECIMLKDEDENGNTFYRTLYRIKAVKDFDIALSGHLGGFIESESNLSHKGRCWVGGNAKVYGSAQVVDDALVTDLAQVANDAKVSGEATVMGNAGVINNAQISGKCTVAGNA